MKKTAILSLVILILLLFKEGKIFARSADVPSGEMCWWYDKPASKYWEGLPVATGRFAAMVMGKIRKDEIWLNEETLWSGGPYNPNNPEGPKLLTVSQIGKDLIEFDSIAGFNFEITPK